MAAGAKKAAGGLLGAMARKAPVETASKSDTPIVEIPNVPENKQALEKLIGAKKQKQQAESVMEQQEEILGPVCSEARKKNIMETQKFSNSVKVKLKGDDTLPTVNYQTSSKYTVIPVTSQEKIQEAYGDLYEKCFDVITKIEATPAGMKAIEETQADENGLLNKIVAACGGLEQFEKLFKVQQTLEPTEFLHQQGVMDSKIAKIHEKCIADQLYKPYKASFRTF